MRRKPKPQNRKLKLTPPNAIPAKKLAFPRLPMTAVSTRPSSGVEILDKIMGHAIFRTCRRDKGFRVNAPCCAVLDGCYLFAIGAIAIQFPLKCKREFTIRTLSLSVYFSLVTHLLLRGILQWQLTWIK